MFWSKLFKPKKKKEILGIEELTAEYFELKNYKQKSDYCCNCSVKLWQKQYNLSISIYHSIEDSTTVYEIIPQYVEACKSHIKWLDKNEAKFMQAILDDGMRELAEDWISGEEIEREGKSYYKFYDYDIFEYIEIEAPLTDEKFSESISFDSISLHIQNNDEFYYTLFFSTTPTFFTDHAIEVDLIADMNENYKIEVNGIAG